MPPASVNLAIGLPFLILDKVDSTNNYAMGRAHEGLATHGQVYFAHDQYAGKGRRGKAWTASPGENITMSVVLDAHYPNNAYPFLLSAAIALACYDFLNSFSPEEFKIKWPNDLYWRDRKAGGILIENIYRSNEWTWAIAGIGININQTSFDLTGKAAVSLKQITGKTHDPVATAKRLCWEIDNRYRQLIKGEQEALMKAYNDALFRKKERVKLKKENVVFETRVEEVNPSGQLVTSDTIQRKFEFGEVEWVFD